MKERFYVDRSNSGFSVWDSFRNEPLEYFEEDYVEAESYARRQNENYEKISAQQKIRTVPQESK